MKYQVDYCVKITMFSGKHADTVVYFRGKLPLCVVERWKWYFEYLVALIKVRHPKQHIELTVCPQTLLLGEDFKKEKIKNLLIRRKSQLKKLTNTPFEGDLFGHAKLEYDIKLNKILSDISSLERGEYSGYVPPCYFNYVKSFI